MKRFVGLIGIVLIVSVSSAATRSYLVKGGIVHYNAQRYDKAVELFTESVDKGLTVDEAYLWLGKTYMRMEESAAAAEAFINLLGEPSGDQLLKEDQEAVGLAKIAFEYGALQKIGEEEGFNDAVRFLRTAISVFPHDETNYVLLGRLYIQEGFPDSTVAVAELLEKENPDSPEISYLKGRVELSNKEYEKAIPYFKTAIEIYSEELATMETEIVTEVTAGDSAWMSELTDLMPQMVSTIEEAKSKNTPPQEIAELLTTKPYKLPQPMARRVLSWHKGYQGKKRQIANASEYLGQCNLRAKKYEEAKQAFTDGLSFDPSSTNAYWYRGLTNYYLESFQEAADDFGQLETAVEDGIDPLYAWVETEDWKFKVEMVWVGIDAAGKLDPSISETDSIYIIPTLLVLNKKDKPAAYDYNTVILKDALRNEYIFNPSDFNTLNSQAPDSDELGPEAIGKTRLPFKIPANTGTPLYIVITPPGMKESQKPVTVDVKMGKGDFYTNLYLAICNLEMLDGGEKDDQYLDNAEPYIAKCLGITPGDPDPYRNMAVLLREKDKKDEAIGWLDKASELEK